MEITATDHENQVILTRELLAAVKRELAVNGDREPGLSNLLREQIRLEDRLRYLLD